MTAERFETLVSQLLDHELTEAEATEFATALRSDPTLRRRLRQELVLWEVWSQEKASERSADAFMAACRTRLRAERESDAFVAEVSRRIRDDETPPQRESADVPGGASRPWRRLWRWLFEPKGLWLTAVSATAAIAAVWLVWPHTARATVVHGEIVCTACILHQTHDHRAAIRVHDGNTTTVYYVQPSERKLWQLGNFCHEPIRIVAKGTTTVQDGRPVIQVDSADPERPDVKP